MDYVGLSIFLLVSAYGQPLALYQDQRSYATAPECRKAMRAVAQGGDSYFKIVLRSSADFDPDQISPDAVTTRYFCDRLVTQADEARLFK